MPLWWWKTSSASWPSEGLPPKEATRKAMGQISGAIVGITLVLVAVFLPMAFMQGSVGVIYQQFSLSMASVSILFSAFLGPQSSPRRCAPPCSNRWPRASTMNAKASSAGSTGALKALSNGYRALGDTGASSAAAATCWCTRCCWRCWAMASASCPRHSCPPKTRATPSPTPSCHPGPASMRTEQVAAQIEAHNAEEPGVGNTTVILGFSFSG